MFLKMYCNNALIEEVPLNYNGFQTYLEHQWYEENLKQQLLHKHQLLTKDKTEHIFVLEGTATTSHLTPNHCAVVQMLV